MDKVILLCLFSLLLGQNDPVLLSIRADALKTGIPEQYLNKTFKYSGITIHDQILDRFAKPYEKKSWSEYRKLFVTESRIKEGSSFYKMHYKPLKIFQII